MKTIAILPARYGSTRFPGKPLLDIRGKTMIQRTYEQALKVASFDYVVVATDDERIDAVVKKFGGHSVMTATTHESGTDRVAEAAEKLRPKLGLADTDIVLNVQGDEPYIHPESLELLASAFSKPEVKIATLMKQIENPEDLFSPGCAKVILDADQNIMYFSRSPIPFHRDVENKDWLKHHRYLKQIGMYGFRLGTLMELAALKQTPLELAEKLEQLRWLENGYKIRGQNTPHESFSIDFPEDVGKIDLFAPKQ